MNELLLLLYVQPHGWLYWMVCNLQYLIMILIRVWGCETDWRCFVCFTDLSAFFTWWSHVNIHIAKAGRYVYDTIKFTVCQNVILKKQILWDFS